MEEYLGHEKLYERFRDILARFARLVHDDSDVAVSRFAYQHYHALRLVIMPLLTENKKPLTDRQRRDVEELLGFHEMEADCLAVR